MESYDITEKTNILIEADYQTGSVFAIYNIAEYNNTIYILSKKVLYIFDKQTFNKIDEILLNDIPDFDNSYSLKGLAVTAEGCAFLLVLPDVYPPHHLLYSLDLATGNTVLIDYPTEEVDSRGSRIGYDTAEDLIWFEVSSYYSYLFFKYSIENGFAYIGQKDINTSVYSLYRIGNIHNNTILFNGYSGVDWMGNVKEVGIRKFNIDNPLEQQYFINVEYLNTLTIPQSSYYDGEHIWLIVERDSRILMLKLLPNG